MQFFRHKIFSRSKFKKNQREILSFIEKNLCDKFQPNPSKIVGGDRFWKSRVFSKKNYANFQTSIWPLSSRIGDRVLSTSSTYSGPRRSYGSKFYALSNDVIGFQIGPIMNELQSTFQNFISEKITFFCPFFKFSYFLDAFYFQQVNKLYSNL